ncbi:MAG: alpha-amylase [Bacteroidetes bacterium]|nr:MAG: alpha-amylase [Bacteroidota bacterium]
MKFYTSLLLLVLAINIGANAQIIVSNPDFPIAGDAVVITYNTAEGNKGLDGFTGDIYAHTGVITNLSTSPSDWKYVIAGWTENTTKAKLTPIGSGLYQLTISPSIREFYGVPDGETILQMVFVFRNADGSKEGKTESGGDIYVNVYEEGLNVSFELPTSDALLVELNDEIVVKANSTSADSVALYVNDVWYTSVKNEDVLDATITASQSGKSWVKAIAYANNAMNMEQDSFYYFVRPTQVVEALPTGIQDGINYIDDNTVILCLYAPFKTDVFAIGDFSDWELNEELYMKKTPDGLRYWIQIDNLIAGRSYIYQYLIDGTDRFADIYCDQVSDPWNDKWIGDETYPGLPAYPEGKTTGIASVFTTAQTDYNWQINNFQKPKITDLVIYETLVRDITIQHSYQSLIDTISYFKNLGINAIELMPINEFEGNESWGYNPAFYFAPDKYYGTKDDLKAFIDVCHQNGIAVIIDLVLNHSYGSNPMVHMYWDNVNDRPAANNPWFNIESPNTDYSWGYDFNHESYDTKAFIDRVNNYWIDEFKVDGFRYDFTKGFTNTSGSGWAYDASRIAILKRMADKVWENNPETYVILEHFTDNYEEKELADYGMMIWGNMNGSFKEAHMGYTDSGKSNIDWASYQKRGWNNPNAVIYMESHDEERQMVYTDTWGNNDGGSYDIKVKSIGLERMKLGFLFDFIIPGPKMIWQFEELGFDISIDYNGRVGNKPPKWDYQFDADRFALKTFVSSMANLKTKLDVFETTNYNLDVYNALKRVKLNSTELNVVAIGNFDVVSGNIVGSFQHTGTWYDYFNGTSLEVTDVNMTISLNAGEYRLYSDSEITEEDLGTGINNPIISDDNFQLFPNPAENLLYIVPSNSIKVIEWKIFSLQGKEVLSGNWKDQQVQESIDISSLKSGLYIYEIITKEGKYQEKLIKQ